MEGLLVGTCWLEDPAAAAAVHAWFAEVVMKPYEAIIRFPGVVIITITQVVHGNLFTGNFGAKFSACWRAGKR